MLSCFKKKNALCVFSCTLKYIDHVKWDSSIFTRFFYEYDTSGSSYTDNTYSNNEFDLENMIELK